MRKFAIALPILAGLVAGAACLMLKKADEHHSAARRAWIDRAIVEIREDLKHSGYLKSRFGQSSGNTDGSYRPQSEWKTSDTIACGDGSWLAYRSHCRKEGAEVYDIFVARGSDGRWYFSDYHFCVGMLMLESQPVSLSQFKHQFFLEEFDGSSDMALEPTWDPAGPRRDEIDSSL